MFSGSFVEADPRHVDWKGWTCQRIIPHHSRSPAISVTASLWIFFFPLKPKTCTAIISDMVCVNGFLSIFVYVTGCGNQGVCHTWLHLLCTCHTYPARFTWNIVGTLMIHWSFCVHHDLRKKQLLLPYLHWQYLSFSFMAKYPSPIPLSPIFSRTSASH